ncbi:hypothetical protein AVEN_138504-1 [Araneus ventricosus]|uniref:Uncharacterized protein n=1 Tax=Araneus ventricosus TaxID=182803 RepID=A0A4Y2PPL5_ARAVE|nr:hypothetical protein AVEN_138504-1 [Araneus ventricosus]
MDINFFSGLIFPRDDFSRSDTSLDPKTFSSKTLERFYWDQLRDDSEKWNACGDRKAPKTRTKGRLQRVTSASVLQNLCRLTSLPPSGRERTKKRRWIRGETVCGDGRKRNGALP